MPLSKIDLSKEFKELSKEELNNAEKEYNKYIDSALLKVILGISILVILTQTLFILLLDNRVLSNYAKDIIYPRLFLIFISIIFILINRISDIKIRGLYQAIIHLYLSIISMTLIVILTDNNPNIKISWLLLMLLITGLLPIPVDKSLIIYLTLYPIYLLLFILLTNEVSIQKTFVILLHTIIFGIPSLLFKYFFFRPMKRQFFTKLLTKKITTDRTKIEMLQKLNTEKDEFLANIAHEIKTPLNGIIGIVESYITENRIKNKDLDTAVIASRRLSLLVNDLTDYTKLKSSDLNVNISDIPIKPLLKFCADLLNPLLTKRKIYLDISNIDKSLTVKGDEKRLLQIFYNIIGNSIKYSDQDDIIIKVNTSNDNVLIEIKDNGVGIPIDQTHSIFKKYSTFSLSAGTGIGLYLSKELAIKQGGDLLCKTDKDSGTFFTVILKKGEHVINNPQIVTNKVNTYPNKYSQKPKIYIADDNKLNLKVFRDHLKLKYQVSLFESGEYLLEELNNGNIPDLIILDLMLPDKPGFEICNDIRKKYSNEELPVVLITARNSDGELLSSMNNGANDFLNKPIIKNELLKRVENQLQLKEYYEKHIEVDNLITLVGTLVDTIESLNPRKDEDINNYIGQVEKILTNLKGSEHQEYRKKIEDLSIKLQPSAEEYPSLSKLINLLSQYYTEKESFASFTKKYKLTENQANIIQHLFNGEVTHEGLANRMGKTKSNISSTLNRIYDKVGVSNQTELMLNINNIYFD